MVLPPGDPVDGAVRRAVLLDVGDAIAALDGRYATGPDMGTGPEDMAVIGERTAQVFCRPAAAGGSGDSSVPTADGVLAALPALCGAVFGSPRLAGRRFAVLGLGRVGGHVARRLAAAGARLVASDIDDGKRRLAREVGAAWVAPHEALTADVDVLVPAALGGVLTPETVPALRCAAIAGPANNQLDRPETAELLHARGIVWAPDYLVSAGGVIHATAVELRHETPARARERVGAIAGTLTQVLRLARDSGGTPAGAAARLVRRRLAAGDAGGAR